MEDNSLDFEDNSLDSEDNNHDFMEIKIYLVPHGYEIDFKYNEEDSEAEEEGFICRDYGGNLTREQMLYLLVEIMDKVHNAEKVECGI